MSSSATGYLNGHRQWPTHVRKALRHARGRVLDIGCGAARHAIYLQRSGHDVVGIDESALAIKTAAARGLMRAKVLPIQRITHRLGRFDTVLMLGNNFGLFGDPANARRRLRRFLRITSCDARLIVESNDIYQTTNPAHLAYQRRNRRRGRMPGQIRFRVRYRQLCTHYINYLMVSQAEMRQIVAGTGWRISRVFPSTGSGYIALLVKERGGRVRGGGA
jgi:SAM-dependent methyltransferase